VVEPVANLLLVVHMEYVITQELQEIQHSIGHT
jgi:hypothetical protein